MYYDVDLDIKHVPERIFFYGKFVQIFLMFDIFLMRLTRIIVVNGTCQYIL